MLKGDKVANGSLAPFGDAGGEWLRCAFHVHTTNTDGWLQPRQQRRHHAWAGYDVLAITDHDMLTGEPDGDDSLLVIGGTELSLTAPDSKGPLHVLGIGITEQPDVGQDATLQEAVAAIRKVGGLPFVAHPVWSGLRTDEIDLAGVAGIEIYNTSCAIEQDRAHADAHYDIWLSLGHRLTCIANDDTHYPGWDSFKAWTMVRAASRTREAVMAALEAGHFYCTMGPRILDVAWDGEQLTVRTTGAKSISVLAKPPYGAQVNAGASVIPYYGGKLRTPDGQALEGTMEGELLTGATFTTRPGIGYARIVVMDDQGRRAWSNPIYVD